MDSKLSVFESSKNATGGIPLQQLFGSSDQA
jgi:hypothetical protein